MTWNKAAKQNTDPSAMVMEGASEGQQAVQSRAVPVSSPDAFLRANHLPTCQPFVSIRLFVVRHAMHFASPRRPVAFEHAPTVAKKLDRAIFLASFFPRKDCTDLSRLVLLLFLALDTPNRRRGFPRRAQVDAPRACASSFPRELRGS